jgi:CRP-like cAMP-binding protein
MAKSTPTIRAEQIRRLVPLNTLSEEQVTQIVGQLQIISCDRGDILFRAGEVDPHNTYYLTAGQISLLADNKVVEIVKADSNLARYPLAHQFPRKYTGRADLPSVCVRLDSHMLNDWLTINRTEGYAVDELDTDAPTDWMSQLLRSRVFQMIPAANIQAAMMRIEQVAYEAGQRVFDQGDTGDFYYFISRGRCALTRVDLPDGEPREIAQLAAGAGFGEDALLTGSPRSCTITMMTDGVLLRLGKRDFLELVKRPMTRDVGYESARKAVVEGAIWLDVRTQEEYAAGHLPGAANLPFYLLRYQAASLAPERHYIAYCGDGSSSAAAAFILAERGFNVSVLNKGLRSVPEGDLQTPTAPRPAAEPSGPALVGVSIQRPDADIRPGHDEIVALRATLAEAESRYQRLQQQFQMERRQWSQALAAARNQIAVSRDMDPAGSDAAELRRELKQAHAHIARLDQELTSMAQRQEEETQEMHQLWEKRLAQLAADVARHQAAARVASRERDELRHAWETLRQRCSTAGLEV